MRIDKIILENFRNYKRAEVEFDSDLVLVVGENASGKTNFLESIYFLSKLKSFRAPDNLLINHTEGHFSVKGEVGAEKLEVVVQKEPVMRRGFKLNGQKIKRIAWNTFKTVLFVPSDLNMFTLGPDARRKFLNEMLMEREPLHAMDLTSLDHILKQRSALLENIRQQTAHASELEFWNQELARVGVRISRARRNFIEYLNDKFTLAYQALTGFKSLFQIIYKGLDGGIDELGFLQLLHGHEQAEIRSGMNLVGPHRDDFLLMKDGLQNIYNSSRGELREQILALKGLQAEYITTGADKPIILLDDVFSELDSVRRKLLLGNFSGYQVFITTTENQLAISEVADVRLVSVKEGVLV